MKEKESKQSGRQTVVREGQDNEQQRTEQEDEKEAKRERMR